MYSAAALQEMPIYEQFLSARTQQKRCHLSPTMTMIAMPVT
jgi:hypothetical protein